MSRRTAVWSIILLIILGINSQTYGQQNPPRWDCCAYLYSSGRWLGWATALLQLTQNFERPGSPADQMIIRYLSDAGRNVQFSNKTCGKAIQAWPNWDQKQQFLSRQMWELQQPSNAIKSHRQRRKHVYSTINTLYGIWGGELNIQSWDGHTLRNQTCAQYYFKIGFDLACAEQHLRQAQEMLGNVYKNAAFAQARRAHYHINRAYTLYLGYRSRKDCVNLSQLGVKDVLYRIKMSPPSNYNISSQLNTIKSLSDNIGTNLQNYCSTGNQPIKPEKRNLVGIWLNNLGSVFRIVHRQNNYYEAYITTVGGPQKKNGFKAGEITFKLWQQNANTFTGQELWRWPNGQKQWRNCTVTLNDNYSFTLLDHRNVRSTFTRKLF